MKDHYELLGVPQSASTEEIAKAYRAQVARYHPDRHADNELRELARERLERLREAFETLKDPERRRAYDAWLSAGRRGGAPPPGGTGAGSAAGRARGRGPTWGLILGVAFSLLALVVLMRFLPRSRFGAVMLAGLGLLWALPRLWRWLRSSRK